MRFRTKPFEIEAMLYTGTNGGEVAEWAEGNFYLVPEEDRTDDPDITAAVYDKLHSTDVGVKDGQWIIRGQKGEYYPCDPEIFEAKYERIYTEEELWVTFEREDGSRVRVPRRPIDPERETERGR